MREPKIRLICIDEMKENELMILDINTGSCVFLRGGEIVATKTISREDIQKAKATYETQRNKRDPKEIYS